jgi:predicted transposase/invertase (TIGR01784 family)
MITDPLFYRLFETSPETFFLLLGMSPDSAREMAARYQFQAIEFKETSHRTDGVFLPAEPGLPMYFVEVQFYSLASVFADLAAKMYTYLKQHDPRQEVLGVLLFASRSLDPGPTAAYRPLLDAGLFRCFYLDELPELPGAPLGLSILYLIGQAEHQAGEAARNLVDRAKLEISDAALRADLIELIETVIIYKLPRLRREEIQAMLQVNDIRETRVYQEAREEGIQEGKKEGIKEGTARAIVKLAARKMPPEEIAAALEVDLELVRQLLNLPTNGSD